MEVQYPTWERKAHRKISLAQVSLSTEVKGKDERDGTQREMEVHMGTVLKGGYLR